ncbi:hypothetical protein D9M72_625330 [compost metagenome]
MTTSSSYPMAPSGAAEEVMPTWMMPARAATSPEVTNSWKMIRDFLTPEYDAVSGLPPMAKTRRPKGVLCRTT